MDMTGDYLIQAPRRRVWDALIDPDVLKQCIPGCETVEQTSETTFSAKVTAKVGPVKAKFSGNVTLSDMNPPESYTISGEGKGGAAGFAKGGARVHLAEEGDGTRLRYTVEANVGGKLAQLGARLIQGTARKMADDFFGRFSQVVAGVEAPPTTVAGAPAEPEPAPQPPEPAPEPPPDPAPAQSAPPPAAEVPPTPASPPAAGHDHEEAHPPATGGGIPSWVWVIGVIAIAAVLIVVFQ